MNPKALIAALAFAGAFFLVGCGDEKKLDDTPPVPENVESEERMFALLVGCTEYPNLKKEYKDDPELYEQRVKLIGPSHDVDLLHDTFRDYLGVPEENITVLKESPEPENCPTKANILGHLVRLAREVRKGDRVVFHFSGHGSQQPDIGEKDELDRLDELLLPSDVKGWKLKRGRVEGSITDDELWEHVKPIRDAGATVWISLDNCHSGGGMRGITDDDRPDVRMRNLDPKLLGVPELPDEPATGAQLVVDDGEDRHGVVATSAAQSYQLAPEMVLPRSEQVRMRRYHGVYTFLLARTLQRYGGGLTFSELHEHLLIGYQSLPWDAASPAVEGNTGLHVLARHGVRGPQLQLRNRDGALWLNAGAIRGLTNGTILDVYKPGQLGKPEGRLGAVCIDAADFAGSLCTPVDGDGFDPAQATSVPLPVEVKRVAAGDMTIPLAIVNADGKAIAAADYPDEVRTTFEDAVQNARFPRVASNADWVLQVGPERWTLERVEAGYESPRFLVAPGTLSDTLYNVFRAQSLRRLARGDLLSSLPDGLTVEAYTAASPDGKRTPLKAGAQVIPGTYIGLEVRNRTGGAVDLTILMLDANYGVGVALPNANRRARFDKKESRRTVELGPWWLEDTAIGMESLLVLAVPTSDKDPIVHFANLAQEALPVARAVMAPGERDVSDVLKELVSGDGKTRSAFQPAAVSIRMIPWRTRWGPIHVPPAVRERGLKTDASVRSDQVPGDDTPWFVAEHMAVLVDAGHADAIATWSDGVEQIYVDADGDGGYGVTPPEDLARQIKAGTLKADLILRMHGRRRVAWYGRVSPTHPFPLRLVDASGDPRAETKVAWKDDKWHEESVLVPWLSTANLDNDGARKSIVRRLNGLVRHP